MKRCPTCQRTFEDALSFCLDDGTPLVASGPSTDSQATLVSPKHDLPPTQLYNPLPGGQSWQQYPPSPSQYADAPRRRVWPWVLAVIALLVFAGLAIVVVAIVLPNMMHQTNDNHGSPNPTPLASPSPRASPSTSPAASVAESDVPTDEDVALSQLEDLENEWERANVEADKTALNRILAREYQGAGGGKAEYLATITPHPGRKWRYRNLEVELDGEKATLTYELDRIDGDNVATYDYVDTFVWRDHRWQATSSRQTQ
jgi:hypothetical protein